MIGYQLRIFFSPYKTVCTMLLILVLPFVKSVSMFDAIGRVMDTNLVWAAIVMCTDVYTLELHNNTAETLYLTKKSKLGIISIRIMLACIFILLLAPISFWSFLWQEPGTSYENISNMSHFIQSMIAFVPTILFFGILSMTATNIVHNTWIGMAISIIVWTIYMKLSFLTSIFNIFAFGSRLPEWQTSKILYFFIAWGLLFANKRLVEKSPCR